MLVTDDPALLRTRSGTGLILGPGSLRSWIEFCLLLNGILGRRDILSISTIYERIHLSLRGQIFT
jgi:hypothetical protein